MSADHIIHHHIQSSPIFITIITHIHHPHSSQSFVTLIHHSHSSPSFFPVYHATPPFFTPVHPHRSSPSCANVSYRAAPSFLAFLTPISKRRALECSPCEAADYAGAFDSTPAAKRARSRCESARAMPGRPHSVPRPLAPQERAMQALRDERDRQARVRAARAAHRRQVARS